MPVTYKPTNVVISPFIRYSGTSAYTGSYDGYSSYRAVGATVYSYRAESVTGSLADHGEAARDEELASCAGYFSSKDPVGKGRGPGAGRPSAMMGSCRIQPGGLEAESILGLLIFLRSWVGVI